MSKLSGALIPTAAVSSDNTAGNLENLAGEMLREIRYDAGIQTEQRTGPGDAVQNNVQVKGNPTMTWVFDPDIRDDHSYKLLFTDTSGPRAWEIKSGQILTGSKGVHGSGLAVITGATLTYNTETGLADYEVTFGSAGTAWVWDDDVS